MKRTPRKPVKAAPKKVSKPAKEIKRVAIHSDTEEYSTFVENLLLNEEDDVSVHKATVKAADDELAEKIKKEDKLTFDKRTTIYRR